MKSTTTPCLECGTTGGALCNNVHQPWRGRGRCRRCYSRLYAQGQFHTRGNQPTGEYLHPSPEHMLWHTRAGDRQTCALGFAADYDRAEVIRDAETFAAKWLERNPQYLAKWHAEATAA